MDKVYLKDIEIFANHGVFEAEKILGQKFILSLELSLDFKESAVTNDLTKSVHYGELCHKVENIFQQESHDLIETVVDKIAKFVLTEYKIVRDVKVLLKKPWAPINRHLDYAAVETTRKRSTAYISLGSNIGDKKKYIEDAIVKISEVNYVEVIKKAEIIDTKPWGYEEQDDFLNTAIAIETLLTPQELMKELLRIEKELDRVRELRWGPRTIDLDIILFDDIVSNDEFVIIPHPQMHLREFVLKPLNDIAPYAIHPLKNKRIFELLNDLNK
jgi:dihydroneopterin aldolase/2-amino-4-hydroxy-6-hydroxymethyldihydropteridine diphosphokinase